MTATSHFIEQNYGAYTQQDHATWRTLYKRMLPEWERHANPRFLEGIATLRLDPERVPKLEDVNKFLRPRTGFAAHAVDGYVPAFEFFDCLRNREFPTTVTVRPESQLDYLPEPDIFHDIAGHVPMHTDPAFAGTLVRFGECAHAAAGGNRLLPAHLELAMSRFFWFTVEFGLMRTGEGLKAYGSGLLSSHSELAHAIESDEVQRGPLQLERVVKQSFEIDHFQPLLFWVESFEHLFEEVGRLERWVQEHRVVP